MPSAAATIAPLKRYASGSAMQLHSHKAPRLCYVLRGTFEEAIGSRQYSRNRGMILFRPAGMSHTEQFGRDGAICALFTPPPDWLSLATEFDAQLNGCDFGNGAAALRLVEVVERECIIADSFSSLSLQTVLWESLVHFSPGDGDAPSSASVLAIRALELLHDHGCAPVTLSEVAATLGVHRGHLARIFRTTYGETLGGRLRRIRAQRAAALIRGTNTPLIEIAAHCGFSHQAHMTRVFRAIFGITPGLYRSRAR
jgi:AraC family transcriptional regulator